MQALLTYRNGLSISQRNYAWPRPGFLRLSLRADEDASCGISRSLTPAVPDQEMAAERAKEARKEADKLACEAWNKRMLGYKGPAQPSPMLGDALNAGYCYLEVRCLGCDTHQTVALNIIRRPKATTPIHELERYMRCKNCSELQGRPFKRSHLVALRPTKISATHPASVWWPGEC